MSKGLEALKKYRLADKGNGDFIPTWLENEILSNIEKKLKESEKQTQILEVLKNKLIDVGRLYGCVVAYKNEITPIHYNERIDKRYKTYILTQEEFDLLKEWLNEN